MYIRAALPKIRVFLVKSEDTSGDVRNIVLNAPERVPSVCALGKVQATGGGEDLRARYDLRERSGSRLVDNFPSSIGDVVRSTYRSVGFPVIKTAPGEMAYIEKQISFEIPDLVKAGIFINGLREKPLRRYMVLHTSRLDVYEKLRLEVTETARAKITAANPVPMEVDALRMKGKGKRKYKDLSEEDEANKESGNESKSSDLNDVECYYCGKKDRKNSDGPQYKVDLDKAKCRSCFNDMLLDILDGRFMRDTQKGIQSWESDIRNSRDFCAASMSNWHYLEGNLPDSGAAMRLCFEYGIQLGRHLESQGVYGYSVEHYGSRDVFYKVGDEMMKIHFEVISVKGPIVSLAALEDAGWQLGHQGNFMGLRRGDLLLRVDRVDNVYWIFGLEGLDKDRYDLVADHICGLEEIGLEQLQVRRPELLPEEHLETNSQLEGPKNS